MAKVEFNSSEDLEIRFEPFVDKANNGARIETGDTLSLVIKSPSGVYAGPVTGPTRDPDSKIWKATIAVANIIAGEWEVRATSSGVGTADPQYRALWWGVGTAERAHIAATQAAAAATAAGTAATETVKVKKLMRGKWEFDEGTAVLTIFDDDGTTPIQRFDNLDSSNFPTTTAVRKRIPILPLY